MILVDETKLREVLTILELGGNARYWEMLDILRTMLKHEPEKPTDSGETVAAIQVVLK